MPEQTKDINKGLYITLEGIDGSGKTSIAKELGLRTYPIVGGRQTPIFVRQPGTSAFAERNRHACLNEDVSVITQSLFYSALINDTTEKIILPELAKGNMVISDRSYGTTCVYQGIAKGNLPNVWNILKAVTPVKADLTIYLSLPFAQAMKRESGDGRSQDRYASMDIVEKEKTKEAYDLLYGVTPETTHLDQCIHTQQDMAITRELLGNQIAVVDANQPLNKVVADCYGVIINTIAKYNQIQEAHEAV